MDNTSMVAGEWNPDHLQGGDESQLFKLFACYLKLFFQEIHWTTGLVDCPGKQYTTVMCRPKVDVISSVEQGGLNPRP